MKRGLMSLGASGIASSGPHFTPLGSEARHTKISVRGVIGEYILHYAK